MQDQSSIELNNCEELLAFLRKEFAYCGCGYYEETIRSLHEVLQFAQERQAASGNSEQFSAITNEIKEWLLDAPGLATWFIWILHERGFIWHGFNPSDIWITDKGTLVLNAINAYYEFSD